MDDGSVPAVLAMNLKRRQRVWVVSELYYPEETSTGHYLTHIAEGLARDFETHVLCSQPTYSARGRIAPAREERNGVSIRRVRGTTLDKNVLIFKLLNAVTISFAVFFTALVTFRRGDLVLVVTNPPLLPFAMRVASALRGARCVLLIHDVYPEVMVASGMLPRGGAAQRALGYLVARLYHAMDAIVVLGRDMERRVRRRLGTISRPIRLIPNWADADEVTPLDRNTNPVLRELGIADRFVVQYSGNMGRSHGLEDMLDLATRLRDNSTIHFLFIGSGAKADWVAGEILRRSLPNVTLKPSYPRERLAEVLTACDLATVALQPGMAGVSVPSRIYNIMASGRPLLAVADADSDVAALVTEQQIGWLVAPGDVETMVATVVAASRDPLGSRQRGRQARRYAETFCRFEPVREAYVRLFHEIAPPASGGGDAQ